MLECQYTWTYVLAYCASSRVWQEMVYTMFWFTKRISMIRLVLFTICITWVSNLETLKGICLVYMVCALFRFIINQRVWPNNTYSMATARYQFRHQCKQNTCLFHAFLTHFFPIVYSIAFKSIYCSVNKNCASWIFRFWHDWLGYCWLKESTGLIRGRK